VKFLSAIAVAAAVVAGPHEGGHSLQTPGTAIVALENSRIRAYRTTAGVLVGVQHGAGVVIWLSDGPSGKAGRAIWLDDVAAPPRDGAGSGPIVIIQLLASSGPPPPAPAGSKPGDAPFVGMSFVPQFENPRVSVLRARMERNAREGFHTHGSDTVVVHLSGGEIEDTADGKTVVNNWKPGDVEFEARGSSHSARNVGGPVDVVLVALK
jgi:quercetin dioxygenase-like cupin family protein